MIPAPLELLIKKMSKLPGLGPRSAQRASLHMLQQPDLMKTLISTLQEVESKVVTCENCGNIGLNSPCHICTSNVREGHVLCVVEGVDDLWAMERSGAFKGYYHVLGGVVSAIDGVGPDDVRIPQLVKRLSENNFEEVILALGASVDGQTTSHLISRRIKAINPNISITTLAKGIPVGAEVDYMDDGTLALALQGRLKF